MRTRNLYLMMAIFMAVSCLRVSWADVPVRPIAGNPQHIRFDKTTREFVNHNTVLWGKECFQKHGDRFGLLPESEQEERVPAKKQLILSFKLDTLLQRKENFFALCGITAAEGNRKRRRESLRPIFVHRSPHTEETRWDTLFSVNGSIAALTVVARKLGCPGIAIDEAYPGTEYLHRKVGEEIETSLSQGITPVVFCSILNYNAKSSLEFLRELKAEYGHRIRTGVGGQLVRVAPQAYLNKPYLDHVGVGDAEVILEPLLLGNQRFAEGYFIVNNDASLSKRERRNIVRLESLTQTSAKEHYAPTAYDDYAMIGERLDEMEHHRFGPLQPVRQLVMESVRGCAWAYLHGTCKFCSLESIDQRPIYKPFEEIIKLEKAYAEKFNATGIFDVSNQFLPVFGDDAARWLERYAKQRADLQAPDMRRYVYLTSSSITMQTAPLLREVGVETAYVGIDGWSSEVRQTHGKAQSVERMLSAAKAANLYIRTAVVIGDGITRSNLQELPTFVQELGENYGGDDGIVLSFAPYMEIILPGSPIWKGFELIVRDSPPSRALELFDRFYAEGWQTPEEEEELTKEYITLDQESRSASERVTYDEIRATQAEALTIAQKHFPVAYTRVKGQEHHVLEQWQL